MTPFEYSVLALLTLMLVRDLVTDTPRTWVRMLQFLVFLAAYVGTLYLFYRRTR